MKRVLKYRLSGYPEGTVTLPRRAIIVHVGMQDGFVTVWAEVPEGAEDGPTEDAHLIVVPTGFVSIPDEAYHMATLQQADGLVWHVYELPCDPED